MVVSLRNFQAVDNRYLKVALPSEETKYDAGLPKNMAAENKECIPLEKEYSDIYFESKVYHNSLISDECQTQSAKGKVMAIAWERVNYLDSIDIPTTYMRVFQVRYPWMSITTWKFLDQSKGN